MAVKFSDFTSSPLNSTGFIVGYDSATNLNIRIPKSTLDSTYQSILVSGTNIKTINGTSVLGSGNLVVGNPQVGYRGFKYNVTAEMDTLSSPPVNGQAVIIWMTDPDTVFEIYISRFNADGVDMYNSLLNLGKTITLTNSGGVNYIFTVSSSTYFPTATPYFRVIGSGSFDYPYDVNYLNFGSVAALVSGTTIKTINSTSLLGSGDVPVQPTLVSGTNIKTVNSTTLLGSGDLPVQPTLVSGTNIKTINGNSVLGSGDLVVSGSTSAITNGKKGFSYFNDFVSNGQNSSSYPYEDEGITVSLGNGTVTNPQSVPRGPSVLGVIAYSNAFASTGYAMHIGGQINESYPSINQLTFGNGVVIFESLIATSLSTPTQRFRTLHGFGSTFANLSDGDGAFFTYDEGGTANGTAASPNWQCITTSGTVRTLTTTTTAVTTAWNKLRIEGNAAGTSVAFYINGTLVATHTTNIPTATSTRYFMVKQGLWNTIGGSNRFLFCDYLGYEVTLTTPRT
jgi:hypothetical protein